MYFERTRDYALVRDVFTHPKVYRHLGDDYSPPAAEFQVHEHPDIWYVIARDELGVVGVISLIPQSRVLYEMHLALLPEAWGARSAEVSRLFFRWVWQHTSCRRLVASIPETNRLAIRWALSAGGELIGVNRRAFARGGRLIDLVLLGISPPGDSK